MEVKFGKTLVPCLDRAVEEVQNTEQTQQLMLPEGEPDVGRIIAAWGQPILRGKEWRGDSVGCSGGVMVWVLYAPEGGGETRRLDAWIPFQAQWDLPGAVAEGSMRVLSRLRSVDARALSPRKILVRAGVGLLMQALTPRELETYAPEEPVEGVELLTVTYPARGLQEAGEKTFLQDEELALPDASPQPEKLICYRMEPKVTDRKVLSSKVVFRGETQLHLLYQGEDGKAYTWDTQLPFSQYQELEGTYGLDAQADIWLAPTNLELDRDDQGRLHVKAGVVAQYAISDIQPIRVVEDGYSPGRELDLEKQTLVLPVELDSRRETVYAQESLPGEEGEAMDVQFLPDFPRISQGEAEMELTLPGAFQILHRGENGELQSTLRRWEEHRAAEADAELLAVPQPGEAEAQVTPGGLQVRAEYPLDITASARREIPMVVGLTLGEAMPPDEDRPSLILRRAGKTGLWDLAKESGSTMEAIRRANALEGEPEPGRMLLIPVP